MWENVVERSEPQTTIWHMRIACWILKATNTHSGCEIRIVFPLQQWLHERASVPRYTDIARLNEICELHSNVRYIKQTE